MTINREKMNELLKLKNTHDELFSHIRLSDTVPEELAPDMLDVMGDYYSPAGNGYQGVMAEIEERIWLLYETMDEVPVREFKLHKQGQTDIWDAERRVGYEKKTGCGAWLYSESPDLHEVIAQYRRKRTLIRWDYEHTAEPGKKNDHDIDIHIECSFRVLFDYLSTYPKGIETFFKYNAIKSKAGWHCFEMNTLKTSQVKITFLQGFNEWYKSL